MAGMGVGSAPPPYACGAFFWQWGGRSAPGRSAPRGRSLPLTRARLRLEGKAAALGGGTLAAAH
eukprot:scaffold48138_cov899-Isochrysis_galbana.AAC.1